MSLSRKQVGTTPDEEMDITGSVRSQIQIEGNAEASKSNVNAHSHEGADIRAAVAGLKKALGETPRAVLIALLNELLAEDKKEPGKSPKKKKKKGKNGSSGPVEDTSGDGGIRQNPVDSVPRLKNEASNASDGERKVVRFTGRDSDSRPAPTSKATEAGTKSGEVALATSWEQQLHEAPRNDRATDDSRSWHLVTYKKPLKRMRVDTEAKVEQQDRRQPKRYVELKVRPADKIPIKPHVQSLKTQCEALTKGNQTMITFHHIEKANVVSVRTDSEDVARKILAIKAIKKENHADIVVQVFRTYGSTYTKGVIYDIYPKNQDENDDVLNTELESEKTNIVAARRLGKTNTAIITFDDDKLPRSILYGKVYKRVFPYRPKAVVCNNCQKIGHKADICCNPDVCRRCGREHTENIADQQGGHTECEEVTQFCQECRKTGHLSNSKSCSIKAAANKKMREDHARYKLHNKASQNPRVREEERIAKVPVPPSEWDCADKNKKSQGQKPSETGRVCGGECRASAIEAKLDKMIMQWEKFMMTHKSFFPAEL